MRSVKIQVSLSPSQNSHPLKLLKPTSNSIFFFPFLFKMKSTNQKRDRNKGKHKQHRPATHKAEILKTHLSTKF